MSDAELICAWMNALDSERHWVPADLDLNRLHLVEQRLTVEQWRHYCAILWQHTDAPTANAIEDLILRHRRTLIHLSTEQKITALAAVLRSASARGPGAGEGRA